MFKSLYDGLITTQQASAQAGAAPLFADLASQAVVGLSDHWLNGFTPPYRLAVLGLGDVGSTMVTALKTLGSAAIAELGIYDLDDNRAARYQLELNQIYDIGRPDIEVVLKSADDLFDCDVFIFTASKYVPAVGSAVDDVRMAQFAANAELVERYVEMAVKANFKGLFCIVSDPVDLLCKVALEHFKKLVGNDFKASRVRGFGLGVMYARARYYAKQLGYTEFLSEGAIYGPHGRDLVVVNSVSDKFDTARSKTITDLTISANLKVRDLGFKPYIAPAISSAAYAISALLEGRWQHSAIPFNGQYLGVLNKTTNNGITLKTIAYNQTIDQWLQHVLRQLEKNYESLYPRR